MGALLVVLALGAGPTEPLPTLSVPMDAVRLVASELSQPGVNRDDVFFVWMPDWMDAMDVAATQWSVNLACNRANTLHPGKLVAGGKLLRFEEPELVKKLEHRLNLIKGLDRAANEGYFHVQQLVDVPVRVRSKKTGKVSRKIVQKVVPFYRPDDPVSTALMITLANKNYAVLRADQFNYRILSTAKDQSGGDGGLYYLLQGIEDSDKKKGGKTALEKFFDSVGGNFKEAFKRDGENRAGTEISGVTDKPRQTIQQGTLGGRGVREIWFTLDISNEQFKRAKNDPLRNLLKVEKAATEVLATGQCGLPKMILTNEKDDLQLVVPSNVAFNKRCNSEIQGMWSCATCHGQNRFYQPVRNDVRKWLESGFDFGADLTRDLGLTAEEIRDKLRGGYRSETDLLLDPIRDEVSRATIELTGHDVPAVAGALEKQTMDYWFAPVTPTKACRELGYEPNQWQDAIRDFLPNLWATSPLIFDGREYARLTDDERAAVLLRIVVPDNPPDAITGKPPEDTHIASLKSGTAIIRPKFEEVYGDMMLRMLKRLRKIRPDLYPSPKQGAVLFKAMVAA